MSRVSSFGIDTLGRVAREFDVVVSGPGTRALPVRCYQTKSGLLQAEFTITEVGQSTIGNTDNSSWTQIASVSLIFFLL